MVIFIDDKNRLRTMTDEFYKNELALAKKLVDILDGGSMKPRLNRAVSGAMQELERGLSDKVLNEMMPNAFQNALAAGLEEEKHLTIWSRGYSRNRMGWDTLRREAINNLLPAAYCSDVIRLIGAIVEKCEELEKKRLKELEREAQNRLKQHAWGIPQAEAKEGFRKPLPAVPGLALSMPVPNRKGVVWGQDTKGFQDKQGLMGGQWAKTAPGKWTQQSAGRDVYQGRVRGGGDTPQLKQHLQQKLAPFLSGMLGAASRGMALKEARTSQLPDPKKYTAENPAPFAIFHSVVARMERAFGYPAGVMGADISGTTADSTYVMEDLAKAQQFDPLLWLLPVGTIVAAGHHHLLEVAGALTLMGIVSYRIGAYDSLISDKIRASNEKTSLQQIEFFLRSASNKNKRLLVYYGDDQQPSGGVQLEAEDWNKVAAVLPEGGASLWDCFVRVSEYPQIYDLRDLLRFRNCHAAAMQIQAKIDKTTPSHPLKFKVRTID